jgi:hypothetical protein
MNLQVKKIFASDWNFIAPTFCTLIASTIFLSKSNKASNLSPLSLRSVFSPIGRLFTLGNFLKITEEAQIIVLLFLA